MFNSFVARPLATTLRAFLLSAVCIGSVFADESALAEPTRFDIEQQPLKSALTEFARQSDREILYSTEVVADKEAPPIDGVYEPEEALDLLLTGTGLDYYVTANETFLVNDRGGDRDSGNASPRPMPMARHQTPPQQTPENKTTNNNDEYLVAEAAQELENIIVTGTSIRGVTNPASPVITFTREDIDRSGLATLPDFVQTIPQNFSGGFTDVTGVVPGAQGDVGNSTQGTGVDLRGLGTDATLTLLNGRRLAPAGLGNFTDISTIPASAVERIEVVLDGASAVYGADAVGGVVNVILRDDFEGAETTVRYETVTDGGRDAWRASQAIGGIWDSGGVFANYEYFSQSPLRHSERSFTAGAEFPYDISSDNEQHSVFVSVSQDLFDRTALFATANFSTRDTFTNSATGFGVSTRDLSVDQYGGVAGLEWDLPGSWATELSTAFNRYESTSITIIPAFDTIRNSVLESEVWAWDVKADGDLIDLPGGTAKLAIGAGTRNEKFANNTPSERDVRYAFAESLVPLVQPSNAISGVRSLELSAAVRYEDYDDFGSSTDGKLGAVWSPVRGLQIRGTVGTSFRAPLLIESRPGPGSTLARNATDPESSTGTSPGLFLGGNAISRAAPELGTPLEAEEAQLYTIGIDFTPEFWPGFSASVSYFEIDFTDRIAGPGASMFDVLVNPAFSTFVTRNPTPEQIADVLAVSEVFFNLTGIPDDELLESAVAFVYDGRVTNIASTTNSGVDLQLGYNKEIGAGLLGVSLSGTYLTTLEDKITPNATSIDRIDTYQNPIDVRVRAGLSWSQGRLRTNLFVNYADSYRDDRQTPETRISSFTTVDWTLSYELGDASAPSLLRNVRLMFAAMNALDEDPPCSSTARRTSLTSTSTRETPARLAASYLYKFRKIG